MTLTVQSHLAPGARHDALAADARRGLTSTPKSLSPIWFYDERGSHLFDEITRLPEYYPTRAERAILEAHAGDIADTAASDTLVELGSGTSEKTRLLLDAMREASTLRRFVPFDVSEEVLREAASDVHDSYGVDVTAVIGDFNNHLPLLPRDGRRLVTFLGSTIGNLDPGARHRFLGGLDATMTADDHLLIGTDLVKDPVRLVAAYADSAGVTAEFDRNALRVVNSELDADFVPERFEHVALWDDRNRWIEMRLRSTADQHVSVAGIDLEVDFGAGEEMRTELSAKFTPDQVAGELRDAGFVVENGWTDSDGDFLLTLARPHR